MYRDLKRQCHELMDDMAKDKKDKRRLYKHLSRQMHKQGVHFSKMNIEELLHARRLLKEMKRRYKYE